MNHVWQTSLVLTHIHKYATWKMAFGGKKGNKNVGRTSFRPQILCWLGGIKCLTKTLMWVWTAWHDWYYSVMVSHLNQWKTSERNVVVRKNLDWFLHLFQPRIPWHRGIKVSRSPGRLDGCAETLLLGTRGGRPESPSLWWPLGTDQHHPTCPPQTPSVLPFPTPKSSLLPQQPWEQARFCWV